MAVIEGTSGNDVEFATTGDDTINVGDGDDYVFADDGNDTIDGGNGNDDLDGDDGDDVILGGAGNDRIFGSHGNDTVDGGEGDDELFGGDEDDNVHGGSGNDVLWDNSGNDLVFGDEGRDVINAGGGDDTYDGGTGSPDGTEFDQVVYNRAADGGIIVDLRLSTGQVRSAGGGDAADVGVDTLINIESVTGSSFDDVMTGGDGSDSLDGAAGNDSLDGGLGADWASFLSASAGVTVSLGIEDPQDTGNGRDTLVNFENLRGSNFNDALTGDDGDNEIEGASGNDAITDGAGSDRVDGGAGSDAIYASVGVGQDVYDGGEGADTAYYSNALAGVSASLTNGQARSVSGNAAGIGVDQLAGFENLYGSAFGDVFVGDAGRNSLYGREGDDLLNGAAGNDMLSGGEGNDTLIGGSGQDGATYASAANGVHVSLAVGFAQNSGQGHDSLSGIENLIGSSYGDVLTGSAAANVLAGLDGNDRLSGGDGNDRIDGGAGNDRIDGGTGADNMDGWLGDDTYIVDHWADQVSEVDGDGLDLVVSSVGFAISDGVENLTLTGARSIDGGGNAGANVLVGNAGSNELLGGAGNDKLVGDAGNDVLDGGADQDRMIGGAGHDRYVIDNRGDVAVEAAGGGIDTVLSSVSTELRANVENLELTGTATIWGRGNALGNAITGSEAANKLYGVEGDDKLFAGGGDDVLDGGDGADVLAGGAGRDRLFGGAESDRFVFDDGDFAGLTVSTCDQIKDFSQAEGDKLRLAEVDAVTTADGHQAFAFVGTSAFTGTAGELRYEQISGNTYVQGDMDGDGSADFWIRLDGLHDLTTSDFVL